MNKGLLGSLNAVLCYNKAADAGERKTTTPHGAFCLSICPCRAARRRRSSLHNYHLNNGCWLRALGVPRDASQSDYCFTISRFVTGGERRRWSKGLPICCLFEDRPELGGGALGGAVGEVENCKKAPAY